VFTTPELNPRRKTMIHPESHKALRAAFNMQMAARRENRKSAQRRFSALRLVRHNARLINDGPAEAEARTEAYQLNCALQNSRPAAWTLRHLSLALAFLNNTPAYLCEAPGGSKGKPIFTHLSGHLAACLPGLTPAQLHKALGTWWGSKLSPKDACARAIAETVTLAPTIAPSP
jgi:hypothetical protein